VPVFRGTRVPVKNLIDYLATGETIDAFLDDFPTVKAGTDHQLPGRSRSDSDA